MQIENHYVEIHSFDAKTVEWGGNSYLVTRMTMVHPLPKSRYNIYSVWQSKNGADRLSVDTYESFINSELSVLIMDGQRIELITNIIKKVYGDEVKSATRTIGGLTVDKASFVAWLSDNGDGVLFDEPIIIEL